MQIVSLLLVCSFIFASTALNVFPGHVEASKKHKVMVAELISSDLGLSTASKVTIVEAKKVDLSNVEYETVVETKTKESEISMKSATNQTSCSNGFVINEDICSECGLTNVAPNVKIIGGITALENSWPAQAYILQSYKGVFKFPDGEKYEITIKYACGGSLISSYTILSAAHCKTTQFQYTYRGQLYLLTVYLNDNYKTWESMFKIYLGQQDVAEVFLDNELEVAQIRVHPNYNPTIIQNDISLFILKKKVAFDSKTKPACLPSSSSSNYPSPNTVAYVAGWGRTSNDGDTAVSLRNVKLTVYDSTVCNDVAVKATKNWNSQICAGDVTGTKAICNGDSGGGLYVIENVDGKFKYIVSGIVSYVDLRGCALRDVPNVYTRTSFFLDWIKSNWRTSEIYDFRIAENSCDGVKYSILIYVASSILIFMY